MLLEKPRSPAPCLAELELLLGCVPWPWEVTGMHPEIPWQHSTCSEGSGPVLWKLLQPLQIPARECFPALLLTVWG